MKLGLFRNNESYYQKETKKVIEILNKLSIKFEICKPKTNYDILVIVGGDGTVFSAAKEYSKAALFSIKRLKLAKSIGIETALKKIRDGNYTIEKVMRLEVRYKKFKDWGINDIVVFRDDENANRFRIYSDEKDLYGDEIVGDGVIISTPYGSAAYNWNAGGPVLKENEKKIVVTPICSAYSSKRLNLKNRIVKRRIEKSKVLSFNKEIVIKFFRSMRNKIVPDGRNEERIYANTKSGDSITIRKSRKYSKIVRILK